MSKRLIWGMNAMGRGSILSHATKVASAPIARGSADAQTYLGILHQIISALEPVVKLRHPPGGDDLEAGQRGQRVRTWVRSLPLCPSEDLIPGERAGRLRKEYWVLERPVFSDQMAVHPSGPVSPAET